MASDLPPRWRSRRLAVEEFHGDHWEGMFVCCLLGAMGIAFLGMAVASGRLLAPTTLALLAVALPLVWIPVPVFYASEGMRGAVWEDGFRPSASGDGFRPLTYFRRLLRSKVRWGEVKSVKIGFDPERGVDGDVRVLISERDELRMALPGAGRESEAEFALVLLERWRALGGSVHLIPDHGEPIVESPVEPGRPRTEAKDVLAFLEAERSAWGRYDAAVSTSRQAYAAAMAEGKQVMSGRIKELVRAEKGIGNRIERYYREKRKMEDESATIVAPSRAAYHAAWVAALRSYLEEVPAPPVAADSGHASWLPPRGVSPDRGKLLREADNWAFNGPAMFLMVFGIGGILVAGSLLELVVAPSPDAPTMAILGLIIVGLGAPMWLVGGKDDRFLILLPRATRGHRRVVPQGKRVFLNPLRYLALPVPIDNVPCTLKFSGSTKDGAPVEVMGALALTVLRDEGALGRLADVLIAQGQKSLRDFGRGQVEQAARRFLRRTTLGDLSADRFRIPLAELGAELQNQPEPFPMRLEETGGLFALPSDEVKKARDRLALGRGGGSPPASVAREVE